MAAVTWLVYELTTRVQEKDKIIKFLRNIAVVCVNIRTLAKIRLFWMFGDWHREGLGVICCPFYCGQLLPRLDRELGGVSDTCPSWYIVASGP